MNPMLTVLYLDAHRASRRTARVAAPAPPRERTTRRHR